MAINVNGSYPATYDSDDVYDEQGYGRIYVFNEESGGTTSPIDLTNYTPIYYRVQQSDDDNILELSIDEGEASGTNISIEGVDNNELSVSVPPIDDKYAARLYRHELELTLADGSPAIMFIGNLPIKDLFSK